MKIVAWPARRTMVVVLIAALLAAGAWVALLLDAAKPARAASNPNNYDCRGHVEKGVADEVEPTLLHVKYVFACSGPITGYQIQPDHAVQGMDTEVFGIDRTTKQVVATDAFSCQGDIPGYGINCTGTYGGNYDVVAGEFSIDEKLCDEPRVDPLLTVVYATADKTGKITQAISGPYDLGRPRGCPKSARNGKWRIPHESEESTIQ